MVDRHDLAAVITLFHPAFTRGTARLDGAAAQHARVRRVEKGDAVRLVNGAGDIGTGTIVAVARNDLTIDVERVERQPPPTPLEIVVPVADRDRMLLAAEKCVELRVTGWRPVYYARSRSVSPRGEGAKFREKVRARMQSALEQSGGAWLPVMLEEIEFMDVVRANGEGRRVLLDVSGEALELGEWREIGVVAAGPEGGLEPSEVAAAREHGWRVASLSVSTLRFETAIIAAAAVIRAAQLPRMVETQRSV